MNSSTFPLFSHLPPELRTQIWRDALPDEELPALYPYKRGCWHPRWLSPSDEGYSPGPHPNIWMEFRHDLLDNIQVELPLVFVNHEARSITLAWARQQNINIRFCESRQYHIFTRPFNPNRDALYIMPERLYDFYMETYDRMDQPDLFDHFVTFPYPFLYYFAVPEALLPADGDPLVEMFREFSCPKVLFVIVNTPPEFTDHELKVQPQWGLERPEQGRALCWDPNRQCFDWGDGEYFGDEALYWRIEEGSKKLIPGLVSEGIRSLEIRPVRAIRR